MHYWKLKKDLIQDIKKRGIRYEAMNGNGIKVEKTNESVQNLQKTTAIMLKILSDLGLRDQISNESEADGYLINEIDDYLAYCESTSGMDQHRKKAVNREHRTPDFEERRCFF